MNEKEINVLNTHGKAGRQNGKSIIRKKMNITISNDIFLTETDAVTELKKIITDESINKKLMNEIKCKISAYKRYDKKKCKDKEEIITEKEIINKIMEQEIKCYYCHSYLHLLYSNRYDPLQWSVDRIDNSKGHSNTNCVISCYRCNIKRRTKKMEDYYRDNNLKIDKLE